MKVFKSYQFVVCVFLLVSFASKAQTGINDTVRVHAYITLQGDTIPMSYLPYVLVEGKMNKQQQKRYAEWTRLRNAVYVTYPYAKAASKIMNEINARLVNVNDRKKRKEIIHSKEKELRKEFTDKLTNLSIYQGKVLMKLIYRETGNSCYEILDEYKGSFNAVLYQSVAFFFGTSLKQVYEPLGKDADMEKIVKDVEKMYGYNG
jgi:hypothetical protein